MKKIVISTVYQKQCVAKKFQNWGKCPTTFEKVGTFRKIVGHNRKQLLAKKSYGKYNNTFFFTSNYHN